MAFKIFHKSEEHDFIIKDSMMHKSYISRIVKKGTFWGKTRHSKLWFKRHEQNPQADLNSVSAVHKPDKWTTMLWCT